MRQMNVVVESAGKSIAHSRSGVAAVSEDKLTRGAATELWVTMKETGRVNYHPFCLWVDDISKATTEATQVFRMGKLPVFVRHLSQPVPDSQVLRDLHSKGIPLVSIADSITDANSTIFKSAVKQALHQYLNSRPIKSITMATGSGKAIARGKLRAKGSLTKEERDEEKYLRFNRVAYDDGIR